MNKLVEKMSAANSVDTNISAQITIIDLIDERDNRDLFNTLITEENLLKIKSYTLDKAASTY